MTLDVATLRRRNASSLRSLVTILVVLSHFVPVKSFVNPSRQAQTTTLHSATPHEDADSLTSLEETFDYQGRLPRRGNDFRCGFCSIIGAANMGKSTLLNALLEENLCSVTRRPQTTRHAILGVLTTESTQLCLVDTPGVIGEPAYKLQEGMMEAVMGAFNDADILLVVTDIFSTPIPNDNLLERIQKTRKPVIVVINKIDLADKASVEENLEEGRTVTLPQAVAKWRFLVPNALAILPVSASEGTAAGNVHVLRKILLGESDIPAALRDLGRPIPGMFRGDSKILSDEEARALLPVSPPLYDEETLTDRSERFFASEMIRASLFQNLKKELPYCCEVQVTEFKESKNILRMKATIFVERDSQKSIVIGKGGEALKKVGMEARKQLEEFFGMQVYVELNVKVDKDWRKNESRLKQLGYLK